MPMLLALINYGILNILWDPFICQIIYKHNLGY